MIYDVIVAGAGPGDLSLMVLREYRLVDDAHTPCLPQVAEIGAGG